MANRLKKFTFLSLSCLLGLVFAGEALAGGKVWLFGWPPGHAKWREFQNYQPYLEDARPPNSAQWSAREWQPEDWTGGRIERAQELIAGLYASNILKEQTSEDGVPVVVVGPHFYRLSGYDKRRIARLIDGAYGITSRSRADHGDGAALFSLRDWYTKRIVGIYTRAGLQLQ